MAQYDVYRLSGGLVVDVQSNLLSDFDSRVTVPLMPPERAPVPNRRMNPSFEIDGERLVMVTQFMAAVPAQQLKRPVASLDAHHDRIRSAVDVIFNGV
jgi:toxin CcdB